jgi:hypothetical protein
MTDTKTILLKKELITKLQKRIGDMKPGNKIPVAELVYVSMSDGFSKRIAYDIVENYAALGVVSITYKDGSPFIISKPQGEVFDHD